MKGQLDFFFATSLRFNRLKLPKPSSPMLHLSDENNSSVKQTSSLALSAQDSFVNAAAPIVAPPLLVDHEEPVVVDAYDPEEDQFSSDNGSGSGNDVDHAEETDDPQDAGTLSAEEGGRPHRHGWLARERRSLIARPR